MLPVQLMTVLLAITVSWVLPQQHLPKNQVKAVLSVHLAIIAHLQHLLLIHVQQVHIELLNQVLH